MVDHIGRRAVSIGSDLLSALSVLAIPVVSLLYGLTPTTVVLLAVMGALFDPAGYTARKALLTDTARATGIDQERLNGIHEGTFGVAWIAGPALATWLIAAFGAVQACQRLGVRVPQQLKPFTPLADSQLQVLREQVDPMALRDLEMFTGEERLSRIEILAGAEAARGALRARLAEITAAPSA